MTSIGNCLWIKFIAASIIPSCRSWWLKIISLSFTVRSKFSIHVLLVCAISGGEIGISLRSFFKLIFFVFDRRFDNWLEKVVGLSARILNLWSVENRVKRTFCFTMSSLILPYKSLQCEIQRLIFLISGVFIQIIIGFLEWRCVKCDMEMISNIQILWVCSFSKKYRSLLALINCECSVPGLLK